MEEPAPEPAAAPEPGVVLAAGEVVPPERLDGDVHMQECLRRSSSKGRCRLMHAAVNTSLRDLQDSGEHKPYAAPDNAGGETSRIGLQPPVEPEFVWTLMT